MSCFDRCMSEKIIQAARSVATVAKKFASTGERAGKISPEVLAELTNTDLLRMGMPASLGGPEVDTVTSAKAIIALAEGDAAAAWYPTVSTANSLFTHYLAEDTAREIFDGTAPVGSSGMPNGTGQFVDGGLRVDSGRWPWGSAGAVAAWMGIRMVVDGKMLLAFVPATDFTVENNWHALGMQATASGDFSVRPGTFIPDHRILDTTVLVPRVETPLTRFPATAYATFGFSAVAIGNAIGAIGELVDLAASKTPLSLPGKLVESSLVQLDLARAEARLYSAQAFFLEALDELWVKAVAGEVSSTQLRARARLAMSHAVAEAASVIDMVYSLGGGTVVFSDNPLQKRLRDAHVITQQVQVSSRIYPLYGKMRLGLELEPSAWQLAI
jgi:indole-3-acetate monooxygenase